MYRGITVQVRSRVWMARRVLVMIKKGSGMLWEKQLVNVVVEVMNQRAGWIT